MERRPRTAGKGPKGQEEYTGAGLGLNVSRNRWDGGVVDCVWCLVLLRVEYMLFFLFFIVKGRIGLWIQE